eukprot:evm.model.scf_484.7 EVM.evm.TU.scf_484.7   scf_484:69744-74867(+)
MGAPRPRTVAASSSPWRRSMTRFLHCLAPETTFEEPGGQGAARPDRWPSKAERDGAGQAGAPPPTDRTADRQRVERMCKTVKGRKIRKHYDLGDKIGSGGFASVVGATHKASGKEYACKIIKIPQKGEEQDFDCMTRDQILREIDIAGSLHHENVVGMKEFFLSRRKAYLVMEMMHGGSLVHHIVKKGHLDEEEARLVFRQVLQGISYLHKKNVIHRDVKLENILLGLPGDLSSVKLTDFGLSKVCRSVTGTRVGTPEYAAPDMFQNTGSNKLYGKSVDMWAAGVTLYAMLAGKQPFRSTKGDDDSMVQRIVDGAYEFDGPEWDGVSDGAKDLIASLLVCDSNSRLTADAALEHPWFSAAIAK